MTSKTAIEWATDTWNPVLGCSHASPGCDNCYAESLTGGRLRNVPAYAGLAVRGTDGRPRFTGELRTLDDRMLDPIRKTKPRRWFVNSMSDLFHSEVARDTIEDVFATMATATWHQFLVLTKRAPRMSMVVGDPGFRDAVRRKAALIRVPASTIEWPLPNVWLGVSVESDEYVFRARHLRETPAAVRFISTEPLLGALPSLELGGIDWVIVGGESGAHARPMAPEWATNLRDRCVDAGVAFHFKQWGEWAPADDHPYELPSGRDKFDRSLDMARVGKKAAGRLLDGRTWDEEPQPLGGAS